MRGLKVPAYLELFPAFETEKRGSDKGDTAPRVKYAIATKRKALYWCAVFSSYCVEQPLANHIGVCIQVVTSLPWLEEVCGNGSVFVGGKKKGSCTFNSPILNRIDDRDDAVTRPPASRHCDPGSMPGGVGPDCSYMGNVAGVAAV
ncbi:hypothetical protein PR048_025985 [Dryococelus australis]|uniref:Uncharacterized protein n=1 Tax=Dryococelus australis TaxID=614101 RepID=A0ABQ9GK28_9NEOP|nr:hypothetical protein PR048_025985 [Dryococelus australis]